MTTPVEYKGMEIIPQQGGEKAYFKLEVMSRTVINEAAMERCARDGDTSPGEMRVLASLSEDIPGFTVTRNPNSLSMHEIVDALFTYADGRSAEAEMVEITDMGDENANDLRNKAKIANIIGLQCEALFKSWIA